LEQFGLWPRQRGVVVIVSAKETQDRGFESRQNVRGLRHCHAVRCDLHDSHWHCVYLFELNKFKNRIKKQSVLYLKLILAQSLGDWFHTHAEDKSMLAIFLQMSATC
jgi:hypothetical protein